MLVDLSDGDTLDADEIKDGDANPDVDEDKGLLLLFPELITLLDKV